MLGLRVLCVSLLLGLISFTILTLYENQLIMMKLPSDMRAHVFFFNQPLKVVDLSNE